MYRTQFFIIEWFNINTGYGGTDPSSILNPFKGNIDSKL